MTVDWASLKREVRAAVFDTFKVPVVYTGPGGTPGPVNVFVKLHGKLVVTGDIGSNGLTEVIEGINQVVFNVEELAAMVPPLVPAHRGKITFPPIYGGVEFTLDAQKPMDGPIDLMWSVARVS